MSSTVGVEGPTPIYPSGMQTALTVKNVGADTVWLDNAPIMTATGLPLGPGSSLVWDAKRPLFAYGNSQLSITENSGNIFDAQAVADSIVAGGLAGDIADQISLTGVPTIVRYVTLSEGTLTQGGQVALTLPDVYGMLRVYLQAPSGTSWTSLYGVRMTFLDNWQSYDLHALENASQWTYYDIPVSGNSVVLDGSELTTRDIAYRVVGITSNSSRPSMYHYAAVDVQSGSAVPANVNISPSGGVTFRLSSLGAITGRIWAPFNNGRNFVSFKVNGGSAAASLQFFEPRGGVYNAVATVETTGGGRVATEVVLPANPVGIYYSFGTGASSAEISIQPC